MLNKHNIRILIISYDFYPNVGGVAAHVLNISKSLVKLGNEVYVLTLRYYFKQKFYEIIDDVKVIRFFTFNIPKIRGFFFLLQASIFLFLFSFFKKINIIHAHTIIPDSITGIFGFSKIKIFTNHSSQFLELYDTQDKKFIKFIYKTVISFYDVIIAPSKELFEKSKNFFVKNKKFYYLPNGVDINVFYTLDTQEKDKIKKNILEMYGLSNKKFLILCPRRLEPKNGVEFFIEAFNLICKARKDLCGLIVGNEYIPEYAAKLKEMVKSYRLKDSLIFCGAIDYKEMPRYYQASDIVVLPSLMEATSLSALEAMACGVPVIASNIGGLPEIIEDNVTGFLVPPKDPKAIAEKILLLIKGQNLSKIIGKEARKKVVENFSWDQIALKLLNLVL